MDESLSYVWKYNSDYKCMVASAYKKKAYAAESWLISPAINLSNATTATLTFDHAANYQNGDLEEEFQLMVAKNPSETLDATEWTNLTIPTMPTKGTWTFASSGEIDLSDYVGEENVRIAFRYVSTSSAADTWEVKNVKVAGKAISDGTDDGDDDSDDATEITPLEYCQALYYGEWDEGQEWIIQLWPSADEDDDFPYVQFDITNQSTSAIAGTYELDDYSGVWFSDTDSVFVESGTLTITCIGNGEYTIVAEFVGENSKKYTVNTTVEVVGVVYDENNKLVDLDLTDDPETGLRDVEIMSDVYARDGRIYAEEGARIYTVTGIDVTTLNGQLDGVYVVKNGNKVAKVVVR